MKLRDGFVTNSSSSSFIILKKDLTQEQISQIYDYNYVAKQLGMMYIDDGWEISSNDIAIAGQTYMDNFDMEEFFWRIKVNPQHVFWLSYSYDNVSTILSKWTAEVEEIQSLIVNTILNYKGSFTLQDIYLAIDDEKISPGMIFDQIKTWCNNGLLIQDNQYFTVKE